MGNVALVGDLHLDARGVSSRTGDYAEDCFSKLGEIEALAGSGGFGAEAVFCTGDIFHSNFVTRNFLFRVKEFFRRCSVPWYIGVGNHDVLDRSLDRLEETWYGQLLKEGYFHDFSELPVSMRGFIRAIPAYGDIMGICGDEDRGRVRGLVIHHHIEEFFADSLVLPISVLRGYFPNLVWVLAGHDHSFHEVRSVYGVTVFRPGSVMRTDSSVGSRRIPGIYQFDVENPSQYRYYPLSLSARSYEDVFGGVSSELDLGRVDSLASFIESVKSAKGQSFDVHSVIQELYDTLSVVRKEEREYVKSVLLKDGWSVEDKNGVDG